jgi:restriction system protein
MKEANGKKLSPSRSIAAKTLFAAMQVLKENNGELSSGKVIEAVGKRVELDDWAREVYAKSGYIRWQSILHFFSIDAMKAGYLRKKKGIWYLTPEGEKALELGEIGFLDSATTKYREWREKNPKLQTDPVEIEEVGEQIPADFSVDAAESLALEGIQRFIFSKNAYEFQDISAALLRAMDYHTPWIAPKGKDGGVDILAYRDPLGAMPPRIKVQVKHRKDSPVTVQEVRELLGLLSKDGDSGLFISSGGYTQDAREHARNANTHVELIDLERFIELWQEFFAKMPEDDQAMLPLVPIYYLARS